MLGNRWRRRSAAAAVSAAVLLFTSPALAYNYYPPTPSGTLEVQQPVIGLRLNPSPGDNLHVVLSLQGQTVPLSYGNGGYWYTPLQPLQPGSYSGTITVTGTRAGGGSYNPLTLPIHFTVAADAATTLPGVSLNTAQAVVDLNRIRVKLGLPPVAANTSLQAASLAHARYVVDNWSLYSGGSVSIHEETNPALAGFTGQWPWTRDQGFGFGAPSGEVMAESTEPLTAHQAISSLMDTIWHRLGMLSPQTNLIGVGLTNRTVSAFVMDVGLAGTGKAPAVTEYPYPGQIGVGTTFYGEDPNPLQGKTTATTAGYPITMSFNEADVKSVQVSSATLSDSAGPVPAWEYDDHTWTDANPTYSGVTMGNSVALIAQTPLQPATTYTVQIQGTLQMASGPSQPFDQEWAFTTAGDTPVTWSQGGRVFVTGTSASNLSVSYSVPDAFHWSQVQQIGGLLVLPSGVGVRAISPPALLAGGAPFSDVGSVPWALSDIYAAKLQGWIQGTGPGTFSPNTPLTQAQALTLLYRAVGQPPGDGGQAPASFLSAFPTWAQPAATWALNSGVLTSGATMTPDGSASRAQFTAWMVRSLAGHVSATPTFADSAAIPLGYRGAVGWAQQSGLAQGIGNNTFDPAGSLTRAQAAVLLARAFLGTTTF